MSATERGLAYLEEFLDTIVALPHEAQRKLTLLREQEEMAASAEEEAIARIHALLEQHPEQVSGDINVRNEFDEVAGILARSLAASDRKVALAKSLKSLVDSHVHKLEDEIKGFEEEMRLARAQGELEQEELVEMGQDESAEEANRAKRPSRRRKDITSKRNSGGPAVNAPRLAENAHEFDQPPASPERPGSPHSSVGASAPVTSGQEPTYCYCNQVSFGEMVACDDQDCYIEWFHYGCVGLSNPPPGKWYCPDCTARNMKSQQIGTIQEVSEAAEAGKEFNG